MKIKGILNCIICGAGRPAFEFTDTETGFMVGGITSAHQDTIYAVIHELGYKPDEVYFHKTEMLHREYRARTHGYEDVRATKESIAAFINRQQTDPKNNKRNQS